MKSFPSPIQTLLAADQKAPVHLYELTFNENTVLRYASAREDVTFPATGNSKIWRSKGIVHSLADQSANSKCGKATVQWADGSGEIRGYNLAESLSGKKLICYRVFRGFLENEENKIVVFSGIITRVGWDYEWFTMEAALGETLRQKLPRRSYTTRCPWKPGGPECNADGKFNLTNSTFIVSGAMTGSGDQFTDTNRIEAAEYWKCGSIRIRYDGHAWNRKVIDFNAGVFVLDYPVDIPANSLCTYEVTRGCDGSWATCQGKSAYGPSGDNSLNYGGFLHINESEEKY